MTRARDTYFVGEKREQENTPTQSLNQQSAGHLLIGDANVVSIGKRGFWCVFTWSALFVAFLAHFLHFLHFLSVSSTSSTLTPAI